MIPLIGLVLYWLFVSGAFHSLYPYHDSNEMQKQGGRIGHFVVLRIIDKILYKFDINMKNKVRLKNNENKMKDMVLYP